MESAHLVLGRPNMHVLFSGYCCSDVLPPAVILNASLKWQNPFEAGLKSEF